MLATTKKKNVPLRCNFFICQPFISLDGVDSANVPYYGGNVEEADYCPFVRVSNMGCLSAMVTFSVCHGLLGRETLC